MEAHSTRRTVALFSPSEINFIQRIQRRFGLERTDAELILHCKTSLVKEATKLRETKGTAHYQRVIRFSGSIRAWMYNELWEKAERLKQMTLSC